ncbi:double-stranded RNA-specific adenosine deaminase-like isoform X2 [Ostrea edulis]|nr:double-stranded RNA-specific adenosine deaminase-like isoform X2 [Ostrea edulis]
MDKEFDRSTLHRLQKNSISAFMEYGQKIGRKPELTCQPRGARFMASACLDDEEICQAEAPNKKDARTRVADMALRQLSQSPDVNQAHETSTQREFAVPDKDPVSALLEYAQSNKQTSQIKVDAQTGPAHCPLFRMYAMVGDRKFRMVEHGNKKEGKKLAANEALLQLQREGKIPKPRTVISCLGGASNRRRKDNFQDICPPGKNPLQVFNEYAQSQQVTCDVIETSPRKGPPHDLTFYMAACLNDEKFPTVTGKSMTEAKNRATAKALRKLQNEGRYELATQRSGVGLPQTIKTWDDKVAAETLKKFDSVVSTVKEDISGPKVLASILLYNKRTETLSAVSIGTGNRCITGNNLCVEGTVINDSHAEIIAKRGFRRFLYREIRRSHSTEGSEILHRGKNGKLKLSSHLSLHLFISTAPCGDGAVFTRACPGNDDSTHQPIFENQQHGHLRTKVENGEGAIPVDDTSMQTLDGIRRGSQRLRTMSCSDKICRWNAVGVQGALLSMFVKPMYLSSITLGFLFSDGHMSRAMCCRVRRKDENLTKLPRGYKIQHPQLGSVTDVNDVRIVVKSRALSINWNSADDTVELTDGTHGQTIGNTPSRLCKRELFQSFSQTYQRNTERTYREMKARAQDYQTAKHVFQCALSGNSHGQWVTKPPEVDMFCLQSTQSARIRQTTRYNTGRNQTLYDRRASNH